MQSVRDIILQRESNLGPKFCDLDPCLSKVMGQDLDRILRSISVEGYTGAIFTVL